MCTRAHPQRISSRGKARVSDKSPRTSRRRSLCVSGSWRAERAARAATGRLPRTPRHAAPTSARVRVGVRVGPVELKLYGHCMAVCRSGNRVTGISTNLRRVRGSVGPTAIDDMTVFGGHRYLDQLTQANSAFYPQRDGERLTANGL